MNWCANSRPRVGQITHHPLAHSRTGKQGPLGGASRWLRFSGASRPLMCRCRSPSQGLGYQHIKGQLAPLQRSTSHPWHHLTSRHTLALPPGARLQFAQRKLATTLALRAFNLSKTIPDARLPAVCAARARARDAQGV